MDKDIYKFLQENSVNKSEIDDVIEIFSRAKSIGKEEKLLQQSQNNDDCNSSIDVNNKNNNVDCGIDLLNDDDVNDTDSYDDEEMPDDEEVDEDELEKGDDESTESDEEDDDGGDTVDEIDFGDEEVKLNYNSDDVFVIDNKGSVKKRCSNCGQYLRLISFNITKDGGVSDICKKCEIKKHRPKTRLSKNFLKRKGVLRKAFITRIQIPIHFFKRGGSRDLLERVFFPIAKMVHEYIKNRLNCITRTLLLYNEKSVYILLFLDAEKKIKRMPCIKINKISLYFREFYVKCSIVDNRLYKIKEGGIETVCLFNYVLSREHRGMFIIRKRNSGVAGKDE